MESGLSDSARPPAQAKGSEHGVSPTRLEDAAQQLAKSHRQTSDWSIVNRLTRTLEELESELRDAHRQFSEAPETQVVASYSAEWLLDNFHVVLQTLRQIREDMPAGYYRQLPKLRATPLAGHPRVFALAREFTHCCASTFDLDQLTRFVHAYQGVTPLKTGELWALPTMLRLEVVTCLAQAVSRVLGGRGRQGDDAAGAGSARHPDDETNVANAIICLRMLATQDWKEFFESVSRTERVLRRDPTGDYGRMDFDTRDRYRGVIEALSSEHNEEEVAAIAVELATEELQQIGQVHEQGAEALPREGHVGYYLLDEGRRVLEARLGYRPPPREFVRRVLLGHPLSLYLGAIGFLSVSIVAGLAGYASRQGASTVGLIGACLLVCLPAVGVSVSFVNWLVTHLVPPRLLSRMDFSEGAPPDCRTLVVVPVILRDARDCDKLLRQLELHFLGNPDPHFSYALLTDFFDAPQKDMPEDQAMLQQIEAGIEDLNGQYGQQHVGPFFLLHRARLWNPAEDCWMGWERKRGKLVELNHLLRGSQETTFCRQVGNLDALSHIRYVVTVDADTRLPRDSVRRLVATLAHPLNRPEFDPVTGRVRRGYTVLQPRVEIQPASANRSLFTRIFSGDVGLDLYTRAVSDVYQDLFGEGIYIGKGGYDVTAFERSLDGRVPSNALLSHDLFEGIHGRTALVTDVVLLEDFPPTYIIYARRLHRWVRGDWQLLPWLFRSVPGQRGGIIRSTLSWLDRWKVLDNLRRSLLMPSVLILLVAGWLWMPGSAGVWTLTGLLALALPYIMGLVSRLVARLRGVRSYGSVTPARADAVRWALALVFLPYETLIILDAIATTFVRMMITRKRLLQWTTSAHTVRFLGKERKVALIWRQMGGAPLLATGLAFLVGWISPSSLFIAAPLLIVWLVSPQFAVWISRPESPEPLPLSADQRRELRRLARRTWLFFEQFVGPDDNWLPPDHFQESPRGVVAHRTSPTNVGLLLLSTVAAHDFGYISQFGLAFRLRDTFDGLARLGRYRGHFLNWYSTSSLEPLSPRYVSTVDSGNVAASLVVLKRKCLELPHSPVLGWRRWQGLRDTVDVLAEIVEGMQDQDGLEVAEVPLLSLLADVRRQIEAVKDDPAEWATLLAALSGGDAQELERLLIAFVSANSHVLDAAMLGSLRIWAARVRADLSSMQREADVLLPWRSYLARSPALLARADIHPQLAEAWRLLIVALPLVPTLSDVSHVCRAGRERLDQLQELLAGPASQRSEATGELVREAREWCVDLRRDLDAAGMHAKAMLISFRDLGQQAERYFHEMDFRFLFDPHRRVFHLGYNVEAGALDSNHYDLLASEARIASLLAIAKGDVPSSHWLHLSRPLGRFNGKRVLLSWSGTMFEYLMPTLFMRTYEGTLLVQSGRVAVDRQIAYVRQRGVPWGISESGFWSFDANMNYQYRAFGVPGLGYKRGLGDDLVVSPYSSLLALQVRPQAAMRNIAQLKSLGMLGNYGLYEAIDYTRSRMPPGQRSAIVRSYMSHHQGMALISMLNCLNDGAMIDRFHADPYVQSIEMLLQEHVPLEAPVETPDLGEVGVVVRRPQQLTTLTPWKVSPISPVPQVHVLSNGRYSVLVSGTGGGYSRWRDIDLTRWHADFTREGDGTWIYVRDRESGELFSAGRQPTVSKPESQDVLFYAHKAEYQRRVDGISLLTTITVAPDDDVEVRRISLTNHSHRTRRMDFTTYAEVVLGSRADDHRHPAFGKLFVESEYVPELNGLLFRRRPRSGDETHVCVLHLLVVEQGREITGAYECDRGRFLGRGGTARRPAALNRRHASPGSSELWLSRTAGATLDPIMALGQELDLKPNSTELVAVITLAAPSRREALALGRRYQSWSAIERVFDLARSHSELELHRLDLDPSAIALAERLLSVVLYPCPALRASPTTLAANSKGQSGLWAYAVSGDYPVVLVRIGSQKGLALLHDLLQVHAYWRDRRIQVDLVIVNERETGYEQELHNQIYRTIARMGQDSRMNQRGGVFLLRADQMSEADRVLIATVARAVLDGENGSLADQLEPLRAQTPRLPAFVPVRDDGEPEESPRPLSRPTDLLFDNQMGGFSADGREYAVFLKPGQWTHRPWINVIANRQFGFLVSEAGSGYTWAGNSGENRLTPWRNDPVCDAPGEALYLRDEETGDVWSPTPMPAPASSPYLVRHGAGYTVFEHSSHGIKQELRLFAVPDAPVKVIHLLLENTGSRNRRVTATYYAEWVLGVDRDMMQQFVVSEFDARSNALLARNPYNTEFGERVAFLAANKEPHGLTADRTEFLGRGGDYQQPAALARMGLTGTVRPGLDPCAAMQVHVWLAPGQVEDVYFLMGQAGTRQEAIGLVEQFKDASRVTDAWNSMIEFWDGLLGAVTVRTPDRAMDLLLNRWLLYQSLACRVWGRSALYQSSGAFGFRDQLQDVMALTHTAPGIVRAQILRCASHQFEDGDVLHWWHPPSGRGVRTRYSDDLLWLPLVTAHYVKTTGDEAVLDETLPFLTGVPLEADEIERYGLYPSTGQTYCLYEHCVRALEKGTSAGRHGLPLMGGGDWNDGMNRVGIGGQGESVWLGWFLLYTLDKFGALCERIGQEDQAEIYRQRADILRQHIEANGWDGHWYRRAYYDDGTTLGSAADDECQIDSIAQSWAVLSGAADPERASLAMKSVKERLVRHDDRLLLLFAPPFDKTAKDPGYIKGYPPGIRENGGQYTHAALWAAWAFAELGDGDQAEALFRLLNPIYHSDTPERASRYEVEPYVVAADVYSVEPHVGRGGWTWYTGSAAWMYRLGLEAILGVRRVGNSLHIDPCLPKHWPGFELTYRYGGAEYGIRVENPEGVNRGVREVVLDGEVLPRGEIALSDVARRHEVLIRMGQGLAEK